jgi:hypothetical protein
MDCLEKIVDLRLRRADGRLDPALGSALLTQMQLPDPAPLDLSELDHRFAILAQITNHLYHDLIDCGTTQLTTLEQQHFARARGERAVVSYDDHPDLEVIHDLAQQLVQILGVCAIQISGRLVGENDLRIHRQGTRDRGALLLAT